MSTGCFFFIPFNYLAGYPAKQIGRISGQFSIRCKPTHHWCVQELVLSAEWTGNGRTRTVEMVDGARYGTPCSA